MAEHILGIHFPRATKPVAQSARRNDDIKYAVLITWLFEICTYIYTDDTKNIFIQNFVRLQLESDGRSLYIHAQIVLSVSHVFLASKQDVKWWSLAVFLVTQETQSPVKVSKNGARFTVRKGFRS